MYLQRVISRKTQKTQFFVGVLKVKDENSRTQWLEARIPGSGSVPKCHGSTTLFSIYFKALKHLFLQRFQYNFFLSPCYLTSSPVLGIELLPYLIFIHEAGKSHGFLIFLLCHLNITPFLTFRQQKAWIGALLRTCLRRQSHRYALRQMH